MTGRRVLLATAILAVGIAAAEVALRTLDLPAAADRGDRIDPRWRSAVDFGTGPGDHWRLAQDAALAPVSPLGYRGPHLPPPGDSDLRIAILGATTALGPDAPYDDVFAARLERAVQAELPRARVSTLLAAAPDYSSHQLRLAWEQVVRPFAPHIVILYSEPWCDLAPALGPADAAIAAAAAQRPAVRLLALLRPAPQPAPGTPRVGAQAATDNLRAIATAAMAQGARVVLAEAARGPQIAARFPAASDYAAAARAMASEVGAMILDLHGIVTAMDGSYGQGPCPEVGQSPAFRDGVLLTRPAHQLIAEALVPQVRASVRFREVRDRASGDGPTLIAADPKTIATLAPGKVTLAGTRMDRGGLPRVSVGGRGVRVVDVGPERVTIECPADLPPGRHGVELVTAEGSTALRDAIDVTGAAIEASLHRAGPRVRVAASGRAPAGARVQIWLASAARTQPIRTFAGDFWLQHEFAPTRGASLCFGSLTLATARAEVGADGQWRIETEMDSPTLMPGAGAALQGIVWLGPDAGRAVLTKVLPLAIAD